MSRTYNFTEGNRQLGYSNVSRGVYGLSNRGEEGLGEVEFMLENERRKFKEAKEKFEADLDAERKLRIEFENKLIKLKDEFSRKDVTISELEFKINNLLHQNQDILVENDRLKHEMARLEEVYGGKIHELEGQLAQESQNFEELTQQYKDEFDKFKKEGQEYVEQLTFDFERKLKTAEERAKVSEGGRKVRPPMQELAMENKKLNDIVVSNKLLFEEELRDLRNKQKEEEIKRGQQMTKAFEGKVKVVEEAKEALARRNAELMRALQDKDRHISDVESDRAEEIAKLRQDNTDLHQQTTHLTYLYNKLRGELAEKDTLIGRSMTDSESEIQVVKRQLEGKKQENLQLAASLRDLSRQLKEQEAEGERRRKEIADRANHYESEARKYKDEYLRICDMLKTKINSAIDNVSIKK